MCDPVTAAIMIASTAASAFNTQHTLHERDQAAAAGIRRQGDLRRDASQRVSKRISELDRSNPQAETRERLGNYMTALRRSRGDSEGSLPTVPGASSRFTADVAAARADAGNESATTASRMARMDAPVMQRRRESVGTANLLRDINELRRRSGAEQHLTGLEVNSIRPNPFIAAIASLGQGFAKGRASRLKPPGEAEELFNAGTLIDPFEPAGGVFNA